MATASQLPRLLARIRQYLLRILKGGLLPQALTQILRRLAVWWFFLRSRWNLWRKPAGRIEKPPSSDIEGLRKRSEPIEPRKDDALRSEPGQRDEYTINSNREIISLDDIACSLYPFDAGGIRSASRSSHNLNLARSAHNLAIATRNASRSSQQLGSEYAHSVHSASSYGEPEGFTITVRSPTSPMPVRKYSASSPQLPRNDHENPRTRPTSLISPHPEGTSTREYDVSNITYPPNRTENYPTSHSPYFPISNFPEVSSPREIDSNSIDIPSSPQLPPDHGETSSTRPSSIIQYPGVSSRSEIDATSIGPCRQGVTFQYLENKRILPVMPEGTQRYLRRPRIRREDTNITIQPLTNAFETPLPPPGWIKFIHVEGAGYFFNKEKRIYTDADLYDPKILEQAAIDIATLDGCISANHVSLPEDADLVIDLYYDDDGDIQTTYYYVHHQSRTIFFLDTFDSNALFAWYEVPGIKTERLLRQEIEAQYWFFLQLFPSACVLSKDLVCELRDAILFFIGDSMTSPSSTAPYTLDDLHKILPLTNQLEQNIGHQSVGAVSLLARFMYMFVHSRFLNFYGEPCARIERDFSVYGDPINTRTWLVRTLSLFLFAAPDFHLRTLQKMWVDGIMHKSVWEQSVKKMNQEWQEFILFGTVMLNANVAFLAIQSVDTDKDPYRSPAQICSYLSVVASIGSIVLGLLLIRQNRTKSRETVNEVQNFMARRSHPRLGLETLAILYSLPYALLMWGMVSFLAAFSFMCFQHSSIYSRTLVGSLCFAVAILITWCVWTSWEDHPDDKKVDPAPEPNPSDAHSDKSRKEVARPTMLSRFLSLHTYLIRRESVDSQRTAVV